MTCATTTNHAQGRATARELLTIRQAAQRYAISPKTIYKWIRCGAITKVTIGPSREIRLFADELISVEPPSLASSR